MPIRSSTLLLLLALPLAALGADGAALYKAKCASCHGPAGEGTKKAKARLEGDRSVGQLADVIRETMPESTPGTLSADEAGAIAAYVHDAFYSRIARERNRPARVELARLTVGQYRNALADVIAGFRAAPGRFTPGGLAAEYYKGRRFRPADRVIQRTDAGVAFDFGTGSPDAEKIPAHEFSARWNGSLLAEETGEYEFVVRTEHAGRLWLNDMRRPLIDAWVKSGNDTEYRATLFLVGGRTYPLRLEYSKAKQGVDDSAKLKGKEPPKVKSSVALLWKRPRRAAEPVPPRNLSTASAPEAYLCSTAFPPDDRSTGWERGTAVSKEWDQATTDAALDAAGYVASRMDELAGTRDGAADRAKKVRAFAQAFAARAFRRPLDADQAKLIDRQLDAGKDLEEGVKRVVLVTLKSPRFLYREAASDAYAVAARLSFGLWDSIPDRTLLAAAAAGKLSTKEEVAAQAERMLAEPAGRAKLRRFLLTWLRAEQPLDLTRDAKAFPGFNAAAAADLRTSLELTLDDASDFRQLVLSDELFLNGRLAKLYGVDLPADAGFQKVKLDGGKRAGVVTHPYLMAGLAHGSETSPIHRGVFLARGVLGVTLKAPPEAVAPLAADLHPSLSTRERVILQTKPTSCMTCHAVINPLGFTLEHFDAVGRYRDADKGKDVDAAGSYQTRDGKAVKISGARELATFLADSPEAHSAFAEQLFHHLIQQPVRAYGPDVLDRLRRSFASQKYDIRKLAVEAMVLAATSK